MKVPAELTRSIRTQWPDLADRWLISVESELDELCRRQSATPQRVLLARFALVVSAHTTKRNLILRATPDPDAPAQASVARALTQLGVAPTIRATSVTDTGTWMVMDQVTPGTPLADADPRTVNLDDVTAPLRAIAGAPAPAEDLPSITDWLHRRLADDHLADLPPGQTTAPITERTHALAVLAELAADSRPGLCHGDASPWNLLANSDGRWMLIDPRGVRGEVEYDAAVLAIKIATAVSSAHDVTALVADATKLDPERVNAWETVARAARV